VGRLRFARRISGQRRLEQEKITLINHLEGADAQ